MQVLMFIILFLYLAIKIFSCFMEFANYRYLLKQPDNIPEGFEEVIDNEKLKKMKNYTLEKCIFSVVHTAYSAVMIIVFVFAGLIGLYNNLLLSLNMPYLLNGVVFFGILFVAYTLLEIPLDLYQTFKIEKKYGFNTMTFKLWVIDLIKSLIVSVILISIITLCVLFVISYFSNSWWLVCWIVFFLFTIFLMYISPYVLEPLFNKFVKVDNEELIQSLKDVMAKAGIEVTKVLKMDASKRTKHTNAYFSGIGHVKRIVLYDTLLEQMDNDEIVSVIAHEAGHWKKKHIIKNIVIFEIISLVFFFIAYLLFSSNILLSLFGVSFTHEVNLLMYCPVNLFLLYFIFGIVLFPLSPLLHSMSRKYEKEADSFAVNLVSTPKNLISALIKLSADNLSNLYPHPIYEFFHYSHPSILKRLNYLRSFDSNK